jgi:SOS-response transcriptional repressor LexA
MPGDNRAERLRQARVNAGYASAAEAAQRFGWTPAAYRHHENGTRGFGADQARKYGRAFKVKAGWLLGLENINELPAASSDHVDQLEVNGSVAAGVWRESEHWNDDRRFVINLPSPVPGATRFGMLVEGHSMDLVYQPGTVLDCISVFSKDVQPKTGDHVIVERARVGGLRELTVKEYRVERGRHLLVPRSSRGDFKPLDYPGANADADPDTHESVRIIAFVVGAYPPNVLDLLKRMGLVVAGGDSRLAAAE